MKSERERVLEMIERSLRNGTPLIPTVKCRLCGQNRLDDGTRCPNVILASTADIHGNSTRAFRRVCGAYQNPNAGNPVAPRILDKGWFSGKPKEGTKEEDEGDED
jgi:hypothetical protein